MERFARAWFFSLGIFILWIAKVAGTYLATHYAIAIPGPVIGMLLVFTILTMLGRIPKALAHAAAPLLNHMNLLFIPAAVGLMTLGTLLSEAGVGIAAAIILSTVTGLWVCVRLFAHASVRRKSEI
jgi:holin-like protein